MSYKINGNVKPCEHIPKVLLQDVFVWNLWSRKEEKEADKL